MAKKTHFTARVAMGKQRHATPAIDPGKAGMLPMGSAAAPPCGAPMNTPMTGGQTPPMVPDADGDQQ